MLTFYRLTAYRNAMNEAKKRIALAVTLSEIGGVQVFLLQFAQYLKKAGHHVTIISGPGDWLAKQAADNRIPFIRLQHLRREINPAQDVLVVNELKTIFRKEKFDAVHLNSSKMGIVGSIATRLAKIDRVVYRIGGWVFMEQLPAWKKQFYILAERLTSGFKDTIICVNPSDVDEAKRYSIKPKKHVINVPNGMDIPLFEQKLLSRDAARQKLQIDHSAFVIGSISNFYAPKNIPGYLDAIKLVTEKHPEAKVVIIGDGPERGTVKQKIIDLKLENQVVLAGEIDKASSLLRALDLFVLPSTKEGMSWSLLEAMATGLPCVATDVGAAKWMFENNAGSLVPASHALALSEAILKLIESPELRTTLAQNAKEAVQNRFPLEKTLSGNASALLD
jgi:glycosyltransferase involved in cell wall biosynthesis